jgi:hypothetical protein
MRTVKNEKLKMSRRTFLQAAGLTTSAGTAAAMVVATGLPTPAAAETDAKAARGYRETDHVRRVYSLSRF